MNKLNFLGIGPIIGGVALPWLAVSILLSMRFKAVFVFPDTWNRVIFIAGLVLVSLGVLMYLFIAPALLRGLKETRLITGGAYHLYRNPLYAAIILFIIPGTSFLLNSWLVLTTSLVAFTLFKVYIKREYAEMEKLFGEQYRKYRTETPEFFPIPVKKWLKARLNK
jgi:protein-S-isoprenylcysteine O-methyltransferase Ste14